MNIFWKITQASLVVFRTLFLMFVLCGIALQFTPIQTFVVNTFVLNSNQAIKINGFSGLFPFYFSLDKMEVFDHQQPLLTIKNLSIDCSIGQLIKRRLIAIQNLKIDQIEYREQSFREASNHYVNLSNIPLIYIANIIISQAIYKAPKQEYKYTVNGNTRHKSDGVEFILRLKNITEKNDALTAHVNYLYGSLGHPGNLRIHVAAKEKDGLLHHLIPTLDGKINLTIVGEGALDNFKGELLAHLGKAIITSSVTTGLDADKKHINIFSKHVYKNNQDLYILSGTVKTNPEITRLQLQDCNLQASNSYRLKLSGNIERINTVFTSNNLNITTQMPPSYTSKTEVSFLCDPRRFVLDGIIKSAILEGARNIISINVPFLINGSLDSLKISLEGIADIPNLPRQYAEYSQVKLSAALEQGSIKAGPKVNFEAFHGVGKVRGTFIGTDTPEIRINGEVLSNAFQIKSVFEKGAWVIDGTTTPPKNQPWSFNKLTAAVNHQTKDLKIDGALNLTFQTKNIDLEFNVALDTLWKNLTLSSLRAIHKESFIECKGEVDLTTKEGGFDWHFYSFNLGDLFPENSTSGTLSILGQLSLDPKDCLLTFSGDFHKIFFANIAAHSGTVSGSAQLNNNKNIQLSVSAKKATAYHALIEDFSAHANGTLDNLSTTISMTGFADQALKGNLAFSISNLTALELDAASIQLGHHKILLTKPTRIQYVGDRWIIDPTKITINTGSLDFNGDLSSSFCVLNASLENIPSGLLYNLTGGAYFLKGNLNGTIKTYGHNVDPVINFDFNTSDALYITKLSGVLQGKSLKTRIDVKSDQLNCQLNGTYPLTITLFPFQLQLDDLQGFETNISASGKLDNLQQIFDLNYDKLSGVVDANCLLYGTINNPISKGYIKVTNGTYQRQNIGLKLNNINLNLKAKNGQFVLNNAAEFQDYQGNKGEIIFAKLGIGEFFVPYLSTEITFKKIHLIDLAQTRRGGMSAFGSGNFKVDGPVNGLKVYARGEVSSLEKYIGEVDETPIFQANVRHNNLPVLDVNAAGEKLRSQTNYDIDLSLDRRFHLFGQGLDTTWKGRLIIQGTAENPVYKGQFVLQEGQLRILDRFFDVQRGEIYFDGGLSPTLYIESNLHLQDMRVKIVLEGDTANLQKRITSDQNLSEQEILRKLFFNRSSSVSQSFQALNYLAASSFISSYINFGFYQQENPITHAEREFISLKQKFTKRTYGKIDYALNNDDSNVDRLSIAAGIQPTPQTKTELTFSPDKARIGIGLEWGVDF